MKPTKTVQTEISTQNPTNLGSASCGINTHFVLAVVAICLSCFTGFFAIPLALGALIFSLRAQDQLTQNQLELARQSAWWAGLFGWITVLIAILPILLIIFFGGAILATLGAALHAM